MTDNTVTVYKAKTDKQGNVSEFQKIGDYIIPNAPEYPSMLRDVVGTIIEEVAKSGGISEGEILILKNTNQAVCIPLSVATGTLSDMYYNNESFIQAIISNTGATSVGVIAAVAVGSLGSGVLISALALGTGYLVSQIANYGYDKLWEWSEKGGLIDLWNEIFGNRMDSSHAEKVRRNLREGTRRIDPLVIDLDGDGIELTDIKESTAMFDLTGSGFVNLVGWVGSDGFKNLLIDKLLEFRYNFA